MKDGSRENCTNIKELFGLQQRLFLAGLCSFANKILERTTIKNAALI